MKLLVLGAAILAADVTVTADAVVAEDIIYPWHVIEGAQVIDAAVPEGFTVAGYLWDGHAVAPKPAPQPDPAAAAAALEDALDVHLDAIAASWGYKDSTRLAGYAMSSVPQWKAEATTFIAFRDAFWTKARTLQQAWAPGDPIPTLEGILAQMPPLTRPQ